MARCFSSRDDYTDDERQFMLAMHAFKLAHRRPYPDCRDVLAVVRALGYEKPSAGESADAPFFCPAPRA